MERPALCAVCVQRNVIGSYLRDLRSVLFLYNVILKVVLERPALFSVCIHRKVKGSFCRDLRWVVFVFIEKLKAAFGETCVGC